MVDRNVIKSFAGNQIANGLCVGLEKRCNKSYSFLCPFPGQVSEKDFIKFYDDPYTLFEKDLPKMYRKINKQ